MGWGFRPVCPPALPFITRCASGSSRIKWDEVRRHLPELWLPGAPERTHRVPGEAQHQGLFSELPPGEHFLCLFLYFPICEMEIGIPVSRVLREL